MPILLATELADAEQARWLKRLREALPDETICTDRTAGDAAGIDIALVANPPAGALRGLSKLRLIQSLWAGVDRLLGDPSIPIDVPIARMVDPAMNLAMAETALWAVLGVHRGFFAYAQQQRERVWRAHRQLRADEVTVAVLGLGQMGGTVARRLVASGYRVLGWSTRAATIEGVACSHGTEALAAVLGAADIVVNFLPLTTETRGLFDARRLAQMRAGASLVNLARGAHVVEHDLLAALASGQLLHAVLDVFETEPLPVQHPLWSHPQVTVLPHVAAATDERSASAVVAEQVRALRQGRPIAHLVDRARGY
jgi:glyoxylate/hydroxypyruvate reductase A